MALTSELQNLAPLITDTNFYGAREVNDKSDFEHLFVFHVNPKQFFYLKNVLSLKKR